MEELQTRQLKKYVRTWRRVATRLSLLEKGASYKHGKGDSYNVLLGYDWGYWRELMAFNSYKVLMQRYEYVFTLTQMYFLISRDLEATTPQQQSVYFPEITKHPLPARWVAISVLLGNLGASGEAFKTSPVDNQTAFSCEEKKVDIVIVRLVHQDFICPKTLERKLFVSLILVR